MTTEKDQQMTTSDKVAFRSTHPSVVQAWTVYRAAAQANFDARRAVEEECGRRLVIQNAGIGHGTRVVGFERLEDDPDVGVVGDTGALVARKSEGRFVFPNLRRKAGKDLAARLDALVSPKADLPGMPSVHFSGLAAGITVLAPALWDHNGALYAMWGEPGAAVGAEWEPIPLSAYYAAKEAHDA